MRFYRPLGQISALTFDLDDTLYDNRPVIDRTMHESLAFVRSYHPSLSQFDAHELNQLRQTLLAAEPEIYHDVTVWRHRALELGMRNAGLSAEAAEKAARDYAAKKNPELEKEDKKPLSGIAERPYCRGRAYDPSHYGRKRAAESDAEQTKE